MPSPSEKHAKLVTREMSPVRGPVATVFCLPRTPWKPMDHICNLWESEIIKPVPLKVIAADHDIEEVPLIGIVNVDHWAIGDWIEAEADWPRGGELNIIVFHADIDPLTRVCQSCETVVGTVVGEISTRNLPVGQFMGRCGGCGAEFTDRWSFVKHGRSEAEDGWIL